MAKVKKLRRPVTVDFETLPIQPRPVYPPCPVGVSIKWPGKKAHYYAWGHLNGNNCSWGEAHNALRKAYAHSDGVLFQNGKFDVDVADVHMACPIPSWDKMDDTLFLLFLDDPHQIELGLKPSAVRLLGTPADERDAVVDWLLEHQPLHHRGIRLSKSKQSDYYAGAYVAYAPAHVTGPYANGDTIRTEGIFDLLFAKTVERGMEKAYDRERELMPILLEMERKGIALDHARIRTDIDKYRKLYAQVEAWIIKRIKGPAHINLNSGDEVMAAMQAAGGIVDENQLTVTKSGKISTAKDALLLAVGDKQLLAMMRYRAGLKTCLGTFMEPWLIEADLTGGIISTSWNQVKSPAGDSNIGTRTGRLSASRFMNMPKEFNAIFQHEEADAKAKKKLPACPIKGLPSLPWVRSYIIPFPGHVFVDRDYSQQEPRILAHFDGGALQDKYNENPWIDFHDYAKSELEVFGLFYDRKPVKNTNLGLIYGMGKGKLAEKNDMSVEEADTLKKAILKLYPGLKDMYADMKAREKAGQPIRTWGGREYYCEEPRLMGGRVVHFDYKMVNVLIQGSAADCTKEAVIRYWNHPQRQASWFLILTVHDQITLSVPWADLELAMEVLRECMQSVEFDVPMLSEGSVSTVNWASLVDYDKKGQPQPWQQKVKQPKEYA